jgi:hypothetical protein
VIAVRLALALAAGVGSPRAPGDSVPGAELSVYLLTFDTGAALWERFGHNAIWIHDARHNTDRAYDYGRFSFRSKNFMLRFIQGDLYYSMGAGEAGDYIAGYQAAGRSIWEQKLDLPPAARVALRDFLEWNIREENRSYHYNYYLDNCSTRIRDAIDRVVGGQIQRWAESVQTPLTYRDHTRRLTENNPLLYSGLLLGLGQPVDHRLNAWQEMFLPISMRPLLNRVAVTDPDGREHPLVSSERRLVASDRFPVPDRPTGWLGWYLAGGVGLGALFAGLGRARTSRPLVLAGTLWALLAGVAGMVLGGLWAFTDHRFSYWNENLFQLNLLSLVLAVLLPKVGRIDAAGRGRALRIAGLTVAVAATGLVLKVLPGFYQSNAEVIALMLPAHLGLWLGLRWIGRAPVSSP